MSSLIMCVVSETVDKLDLMLIDAWQMEIVTGTFPIRPQSNHRWTNKNNTSLKWGQQSLEFSTRFANEAIFNFRIYERRCASHVPQFPASPSNESPSFCHHTLCTAQMHLTEQSRVLMTMVAGQCVNETVHVVCHRVAIKFSCPCPNICFIGLACHINVAISSHPLTDNPHPHWELVLCLARKK